MFLKNWGYIIKLKFTKAIMQDTKVPLNPNPLKELLSKLEAKQAVADLSMIVQGNKLKNSFLQDYFRILKQYYYYQDSEILEIFIKLDALIEKGSVDNEFLDFLKKYPDLLK